MNYYADGEGSCPTCPKNNVLLFWCPGCLMFICTRCRTKHEEFDSPQTIEEKTDHA